jgi:tRNA (guanine37-N1)-methyltransferase
VAAVYCALVHHPVLDRQGNEVTTSVTNLDVHDIARTARTYGLQGYFVVIPIEAQHPVVQKIIDHWSTGAGVRRFPERTEAISLVRLAHSVEAAIADVAEREGEIPRLVATSAKGGPARCTYSEERTRIDAETRPTLILFGTGHGISPRILKTCDAILAPIEGPTAYNHLSVRAAAAITLDRLFGAKSGAKNPI